MKKFSKTMMLRFAILWIGLTAGGFAFQVVIRMSAKHPRWLAETTAATEWYALLLALMLAASYCLIVVMPNWLVVAMRFRSSKTGDEPAEPGERTVDGEIRFGGIEDKFRRLDRAAQPPVVGTPRDSVESVEPEEAIKHQFYMARQGDARLLTFLPPDRDGVWTWVSLNGGSARMILRDEGKFHISDAEQPLSELEAEAMLGEGMWAGPFDVIDLSRWREPRAIFELLHKYQSEVF